MSSARNRWIDALDDEDVQFIRRFILASGSLKALAEEYRISYPTIRARLDRLIAKVRAASDPETQDPFRRKVQMLLADGSITTATARALLEAYRASTDAGKEAS
jgi:hypothetical protein